MAMPNMGCCLSQSANPFVLNTPPSLRASAKRASEAIQCRVCVDVHTPHWIASLARFALARNDGV